MTERLEASDLADSAVNPTDDGSSSTSAGGYGRLAGRITFWSGNLLATCVILVLGITFGRQVLEWWRADPPSVSVAGNGSSGDLGGLADPNLPHELEFGSLPLTFNRTVFQGDQRAALACMRRACREVVQRAAPAQPGSLPAEQRLLRQLEKTTPAEQGEGWRIYEHEGPVLMVLGVRRAVATSPAAAGGPTSVLAESVVSWGLGLRQFVPPAAEGEAPVRWTLFMCSAGGETADSGSRIALPIPPGSRRTLSVRVEQGGALIGFAGSGDIQAWRRFFDRSLGRQGWTRAGGWFQMGANWHTRFQRPESGTCDVQLVDHASGSLSGILTVAPAARGLEK